MSDSTEPNDPPLRPSDVPTFDETIGKTHPDSSNTSEVSLHSKVAMGDGLKPGDTFDQYTIKDVLGEGGMGVVYRAQQQHPKRDIALKLIRPGFLTETLLKRFQLEAEILARLNHPGIAHVYQADIQGGVPYFAMEVIEGQPLSVFADEHKLSTRQRLELFTKICDAVQHAHQNGIIHRDLKPGNILITQDGQPKILDFGVARATDSDIQMTAVETNLGQLVGTVPYMSPEQAAGDPSNIDTRSDVYALGVILFELLSLRMPYDVSEKLIHEAVRVIQETEPTRLSMISKTMSGDIETIVGKALEKEKDRRYQSASAMGDDIQRYLGNEPIAARPPSLSYQFSKFAARNKALMGGVCAVFLVLVVGIIATGMALNRALAAEAEANRNFKDATAARLAETEAKQLATNRANELEVITEFQSNMLSDIDAEAMGAMLRRQIGSELRADLESKGNDEAKIEEAIQQLNNEMPWFNPTNVALDLLDEHVLGRAVETIDEQFGDQPLTKAKLQQSLGNTYFDIGRFDPALRLHQSSLDIYRAELGDEHPDSLQLFHDLGMTYLRLGQTDEAESILLQVLDQRKQILGHEDPNTLESMMLLGLVYIKAARFNDAKPLLEESLAIRRRILNEDSNQLHESIVNLGVLNTEQGHFEKAEELFLEVFALMNRTYGESHPITLSNMNRLGTMYRILGQFDKAEPLMDRSLEIKRTMLGDEHPDTLNAMGNLADLYTAQGRFPEAEHMFLDVLAIKKRVIGDDNPLTLDTMTGLGSMYVLQGNLDQAELILIDTHERQKRVLGERHPATLITMNNVGSMYWNRGLFEQARPYMIDNLAILMDVLGPEHPTTLAAMSNAAILHQNDGRLDKAEPLMTSLLEIRRRTLGIDHPKTLTTMNNLGAVYLDLAMLEKAAPLLEEGLRVTTSTLGEQHPNTVVATVSLAELYQKIDRHEEAEVLLARAVTTAQSIWPKGMWIIAAFQVIHGKTLVALDRLDEARTTLDTGYDILIKSMGSTNEYTIVAVESYIELYTKLHELDPENGYEAKVQDWQAKLPTPDPEETDSQ
ncbi:MAG: serine/threonine-protein kinase [Planctomycetota bacterium]|nr:serine/threonine-protein kinase [Planctomycetota bacterium]